MAERATVVERVQIGIEPGGSPGTPVAATKAPRAMSLRLNPRGESDEFRAEGNKDYSLVTQVAEWAEAPIEGRLTYDEFAYLLSCFYGTATAPAITDAVSSDPVAGVTGWRWTTSNTALDTPKTMTVERGSAYRAHRASYGVVRDLGYTIQRRGGAPSISGAMLFQRIQDGVTLTASPTDIDATPVQPPQVDVYLDATAAGIGTTKMGRASRVGWSRNGKFRDYWVLDRDKESWVSPVELAADPMLTLMVQADSSGMALLSQYRGGGTVFVRVEARGAQIGTADGWKIAGGTTIPGNVPYFFRHDMAVKVRDPIEISDQDGVMGGEWGCRVVHDPTLGFAEQITLVNKLSAL